MAIRLECSCGKTYSVDDRKTGRSATCPNGFERLTVPFDTTHDNEANTVRLPPRRRRRKRGLEKPKLKKEIPSDHVPSYSASREMHPVIVILLALMLMINGWQGLKEVVYLPLWLMVHDGIVDSMGDATDEELAETGVTREQWERTRSMLTRFHISWILGGIVQLCFAASLAGIIMWRGYAVSFAIVFAVLFCLLRFVVWPDPDSIALLNVCGLTAGLLMLKYLPPPVWDRLMASDY